MKDSQKSNLAIQFGKRVLPNIDRLEKVLTSMPAHRVRIYNSSDNIKIKQNIKNLKGKYSTASYAGCYEAMSNYTRGLYAGQYRMMKAASFADVGDMGDYRGCENLGISTYNILQLNVTNLPIEVRLGLCLPKE